MATTCEDKSQAVPGKSFGVECSDRIETHGAHRWDIARGERDSGEYHGDTGEGGQIGRRHAVEQSGHEVRDDERTGHTQPGAGDGQTESSAQDDSEDIASLSSKRKANRNLTFLFIHHKGNSPVDSKSGEQQGSRRKPSHHFHRESPHGKGGSEHAIERL